MVREAVSTLCTLVVRFGSDYAIFIPMINKILLNNRIHNSTYETLVSRLLNNQTLLLSEDGFKELRDLESVAVPLAIDTQSQGGGNYSRLEQA